MGPAKGMSDKHRAHDAPTILKTSESFSPSALSKRATICVSYRYPFGKSGLRGRSVILHVNISFSVGLPSLLKYPPGKRPAAAAFSLYSTDNGNQF